MFARGWRLREEKTAADLAASRVQGVRGTGVTGHGGTFRLRL